MYDIVIVGAGAAGLFCAAMINDLFPKGMKVLLIEKTETLGNKLIISGSGQCNFTRAGAMKDFSLHYGDNYSFIKPALYNLSNTKLIEYFDKQGVQALIRDDLKVFPKQKSSELIKKVLVRQADKYGVEIKSGHDLKKIEVNEKITLHLMNSSSRVVIQTEYLILCTGGASYAETGSTGDIIDLLESLKVKTKAFKPALSVPFVKYIDDVHVKPQNTAPLAGICLNSAEVSLYRDNKQVLKRNGALLFTHKGLSGPLILDNSKHFMVGDTIVIYLTEFRDINDLDKHLLELIDKHSTMKTKNLLSELGIPSGLCSFLLNGVPENILNGKCFALTKLDRKDIVKRLFCMEFSLLGLGDINEAMCCSGGVDLTEINRENMSLKKYPNIYVAGECIDVDGDTGGYNIHAAFAMGYLAVKSIAERSGIACKDKTQPPPDPSNLEGRKR